MAAKDIARHIFKNSSSVTNQVTSRLAVNPVYSVSLPSGSYRSWGIHYVTLNLDPLLGGSLVRLVSYRSKLWYHHLIPSSTMTVFSSHFDGHLLIT